MITHPSQEEVLEFRAALARIAGLRFDDDKLPLLGEILALRVREVKPDSVAAYLEEMTATGQEITRLAPAVTVSETYFFRNRDQFHALAALLRERESAGARRLGVLSAGCSSGEEAYSLAMTIRETLGEPEDRRVWIVGLDVNAEAVERARVARYGRWALRETPDRLRRKYFERMGDQYLLDEAVRAMVVFNAGNLMSLSAAHLGDETFDVVFCRNLLMYLTPDAARAVVAGLARRIAPGGHLFLGHAENLRGVSSDFHLRHSHETFYYERRAAPEREAGGSRVPIPRTVVSAGPGPGLGPATVAEDDSWYGAIARASTRIETLSRTVGRATTSAPDSRSLSSPAVPAGAAKDELSPAWDLVKQERFHEALRLLAKAPEGRSAEPEALLLRAMLLVSTGDLPSARRLCERLLAVDELNAGAHYILSISLEPLGDLEGSIEHSRTAVYLDSEFAMPHLQIGRLARRSNDLVIARRELGLALSLLAREDAARILLFGGGFSRDALMQLCRGELAACGGGV